MRPTDCFPSCLHVLIELQVYYITHVQCLFVPATLQASMSWGTCKALSEVLIQPPVQQNAWLVSEAELNNSRPLKECPARLFQELATARDALVEQVQVQQMGPQRRGIQDQPIRGTSARRA